MVINRLMWRAIFIFTQPCSVTDVLCDVMIGVDVDMFPDVILGVGIDMLIDMDIIVTAAPAVTVEFVAYAGDVRVGVPDDLLAVPIIDVVPAIDVDIFADENANGLTPVMTPLEFTLPAP